MKYFGKKIKTIIQKRKKGAILPNLPFQQLTPSRSALLLGTIALMTLTLTWPLTSTAQDKSPGSHTHGSKAVGKDLTDQILELKDKVAQLETALEQKHQGKPSSRNGMGGMMDMDDRMGGMMGGMKKGNGMGGMRSMMDMGDQMGGMMGDMKKDIGSDRMGMVNMDMMEMMGMGSMGHENMKGMNGMRKMQKTAALPGFPGASHIYHIGATGFFLDHPEHIRLTTDQQRTLNHIKEKALLNKATIQRKIDEAEQELWTLTGSDQPDAVKIETKIREIEKLRGDQRMAFINAVGEAANVLTDEQRQVLLGLVTGKTDEPDAEE